MSQNRWYHGPISDEDAKVVLHKRGRNGSFLVKRASSDGFALIVRLGEVFVITM